MTTPQEVLACPIDDFDSEVVGTVGDYLKKCLVVLWDEQENFSGKRPFGNSGWPFDIYKTLIQHGLLAGTIDEDGYVEECDIKAGDALVRAAIESVTFR